MCPDGERRSMSEQWGILSRLSGGLTNCGLLDLVGF